MGRSVAKQYRKTQNHDDAAQRHVLSAEHRGMNLAGELNCVKSALQVT